MVEAFGALNEAIAQRDGPQAAQLFAEPIVTWGNGEAGGSISWYADADGDVSPLHATPAERRARLEATLRATLARLLLLRSDPVIGPLLTHALVVADEDSVLAVGDRVVLVNWGLIPADRPDTPAGLAAQFEATLGRYAAHGATVDAAPSPPPPRAEPSPTPRPAAPPVALGAVNASAPGAAAMAAPVASVWNRWLVPAALVTAAVFLGLGLLLGARATERQVAARPDTARIGDADAIRDATARREAENAALQAQIDAARHALTANICAAGAPQVPGTVAPDTPIAPAMRPPAPQGAAPFQGTLVELLRQATVLVLVPKGDGLSMGTGFFIGPQRVVTNRHVVETAGPDGIVVVNAKLGRPMRATVVAQTPSSVIYNPDVAVLQVPDASAIQPLSFTRTVGQLDTVVAAGFPGVLMRADDNFARLLHGDLAAMPSVILTDGRINAVQTAPTGMPILPHSAQIAPGNSGGPLVDTCGRVVGINTFVNVAAEQAVHINYAEKSDAVLDFLHASQVAAAESASPCVPGGGDQIAGAAPPAPAPPAPAQPAPVPAAPAPPAAPSP